MLEDENVINNVFSVTSFSRIIEFLCDFGQIIDFY